VSLPEPVSAIEPPLAFVNVCPEPLAAKTAPSPIVSGAWFDQVVPAPAQLSDLFAATLLVFVRLPVKVSGWSTVSVPEPARLPFSWRVPPAPGRVRIVPVLVIAFAPASSQARLPLMEVSVTAPCTPISTAPPTVAWAGAPDLAPAGSSSPSWGERSRGGFVSPAPLRGADCHDPHK
jgi:hypothetical protein